MVWTLGPPAYFFLHSWYILRYIFCSIFFFCYSGKIDIRTENAKIFKLIIPVKREIIIVLSASNYTVHLFIIKNHHGTLFRNCHYWSSFLLFCWTIGWRRRQCCLKWRRSFAYDKRDRAGKSMRWKSYRKKRENALLDRAVFCFCAIIGFFEDSSYEPGKSRFLVFVLFGKEVWKRLTWWSCRLGTVCENDYIKPSGKIAQVKSEFGNVP